MTPKEKAFALFRDIRAEFIMAGAEFKNGETITSMSKRLGLICVDELVQQEKKSLEDPDLTDYDAEGVGLVLNYFGEVKIEIEKL